MNFNIDDGVCLRWVYPEHCFLHKSAQPHNNALSLV